MAATSPTANTTIQIRKRAGVDAMLLIFSPPGG
jgi:hypothetical protein